MKFEPGLIYFNKVYIIQSLRPGDRLTGQELFDDIIRWRTSDSLVAEIQNISGKIDLIAYLKHIYNGIKSGLVPLIHFETHGYKDGIQLSNNELVSWQDLVPYFRSINLATKNNLFISMAACKGGNIQICVKITEPSPFRGFIGPMEDVGEMDLLASFSDFFNVLLRENDIEKGIEALNHVANGIKYHHMNTELLFDIVWNYHTELWKNDPNKQQALIDDIMNKQSKNLPALISKYGGKRQVRRKIKRFAEKDIPKVKELLRKQFCHMK